MDKCKVLSILILSAIFCVGCLGTTQLTKMERDMDIIQRQNNSLKEDLQKIEKNTAKSEKRITEIAEKLYSINANLIANIDDLQAKIETLQGRIEELNYKLSKEETENIETYNILEEPKNTTPDKTEELKARQVFISAQNDFRKGYYDLAILGFKQFLTLSKDTKKLAEAQYWIGECFYSDNKLEDAIAEFDKFIRTYPLDTRVPGSMYKKAVAYFRLKKPAICRTILKEIIQKYPDSQEAKLAEERLKAIEEKNTDSEKDG